MITDKQNEKNREAALKLLAETNAALGIPEAPNRPEGVNAFQASQPGYQDWLKAKLSEFHRMRAEATGATLFADVWKAWKRRSWK